MDAVTALVTIVQLIGLFRQERGATAQAKKEEFVDWLENHRHNELKDLIANNAYLNDEVGRLLREDHRAMTQQLAEINVAVSEILAHSRAFSRITEILAPDRTLSDQAAAILIAFTNSGAHHLIPGSGDGSLAFDTTGKGIRVADPRFLNDDLVNLVRCGFLTLENVAGGKWRLFELTRRGAEFAKRLEREADK